MKYVTMDLKWAFDVPMWDDEDGNYWNILWHKYTFADGSVKYYSQDITECIETGDILYKSDLYEDSELKDIFDEEDS